MKPFSQACENNRQPILTILQRVFASVDNVLEIGSGTGQHAIYMAPRLPHLQWQTSDRVENHSGINAWIDEYPSPNVLRPVALDVTCSPWPSGAYDGVFTANTCHIMSWSAVEKMFDGLAKILASNAVLAVYGPFKYQGEFTSPSNAAFDQYLKSQDGQMGIRDAEAVMDLAQAIGLQWVEDNPMPANNQLLVFRR